MEIITILVILTRAMINPLGSTLPTMRSEGLSLSSVVEIGIYTELGGGAGGESFASTCRNQKMW
jgi:hypothetical protein